VLSEIQNAVTLVPLHGVVTSGWTTPLSFLPYYWKRSGNTADAGIYTGQMPTEYHAHCTTLLVLALRRTDLPLFLY